MKNEDEWIKDEDDFEDDADVIKLEINESIKGLLLEKKQSDLFGFVYKIKVKDDDRPKIICGTTVLNSKMANKQIGEPIMIERVKDGKNKKGVNYQLYETYHLSGSDTKKMKRVTQNVI